MVFNPEADDAATVTVAAVENGEVTPVDGLGDLTVAAGQRVVSIVDGVDPGTPLVVTADQPVVVERRLVFDDDVSGAIGVPVAGSLTEQP